METDHATTNSEIEICDGTIFTIVTMHETALLFLGGGGSENSQHRTSCVPRTKYLNYRDYRDRRKPGAHFPGFRTLQFARIGTRYGATATTANMIRRYGECTKLNSFPRDER